jgi:hypothetical protein
MRSMIANLHKQQIPPLRFASVGMTDRVNTSKDKAANGACPNHPRVGIDVSTPVRMPVGHRDVMVLSRV